MNDRGMARRGRFGMWAMAAMALLTAALPAQGSGYTLRTLASFDDTNGAYPVGDVLVDASGNVFGTTSSGGAHGDGTVFEVPAAGGGVVTLGSFDGTNGSAPKAGLVLSGGNLFGTASGGGDHGDGTVFSVPVAGGPITALGSFDGTNTGSAPQGNLVLSGGNLFGTASGGGDHGDGTVFSVPVAGGAITPLGSFDGTNGSSPQGGLVLAGGNLYGTANSGGTFAGTVFSVPVAGGAITPLGMFDYSNNGDGPRGGLVLAGGNLYGTAEFGGAHFGGTVFSVPVAGGTIIPLAALGGPVPGTINNTGVYPMGGLVRDAAGDLFGTAAEGGSGVGTVFEIPVGGAVTPIFTFNYAPGAFPYSGLVSDAAGDLFGTTQFGGVSPAGSGTVFELSPAAVPEPASMLILGQGALAVAALAWRARARRHRAA